MCRVGRSNIPKGHPEVGLVCERQRRVFDPLQVSHGVLQRGDGIVHSCRRSRCKKALTHEPREIRREEKRNLRGYMKADRSMLISENPFNYDLNDLGGCQQSRTWGKLC